MIRKYGFPIGIILSLILLTIAAVYYPGGSQADPHSTGYDWKNNYLCNLFTTKAINGADNPARYWAVAGMFFLCISMALFFIRISTKVCSGTPAAIIKYAGAGSMLFAFFVFTPLHDLFTTTASVLALVALFYITVFIFKSKLLLFKLLSVLCLVVLYFTNYIYYSGNMLMALPVMQKVSFLLVMGWMLGLLYFTKKEDFQPAGK